jgi:hypothetical protein
MKDILVLGKVKSLGHRVADLVSSAYWPAYRHVHSIRAGLLDAVRRPDKQALDVVDLISDPAGAR